MKNKYGHWLFVLLLLMAMISCNPTENNNSGQANGSAGTNDSIRSDTSVLLNKQIPLDSIETNTLSFPDAKSYTLIKDSSRIIWHCVIHTGYTKFNSGKVQVLEGKIVNGDFEICMDSISDLDIDYPLMNSVLVNTLKSEDFFDIKKYPVASFQIVQIKEISDSTYRVTGNLTIKNVTRQIRFTSTIQIEHNIIHVHSERFSINRTLWGITIYSHNFEQTDDRFLFTDMVDIEILLQLQNNTGK